MVTTLIYAAFFGGAPKTRALILVADLLRLPSLGPLVVVAWVMLRIPSSWTTHPALSTVDGEDELMKNGFKRPKVGFFPAGHLLQDEGGEHSHPKSSPLHL